MSATAALRSLPPTLEYGSLTMERGAPHATEKHANLTTRTLASPSDAQIAEGIELMDFDIQLDADELQAFGDLTGDICSQLTPRDPSSAISPVIPWTPNVAFTPTPSQDKDSSQPSSQLDDDHHGTDEVGASPPEAFFRRTDVPRVPKPHATAQPIASALQGVPAATAVKVDPANINVAASSSSASKKGKPRARVQPRRAASSASARANYRDGSTTELAVPTKRKASSKSTAKTGGTGKKQVKRPKMPEAEQKRRNCESAKRSRLKKQAALAAATKEVAELRQLLRERDDQIAMLRGQFQLVREWGYGMALHCASNHHNCSCADPEQQRKLEEALTSPKSI